MLSAIFIFVGLAVVFGLLLGYAAVRFKVEGNPVAKHIDDILPQTPVWPMRLPRLQTLC
ncbi:Electron transport complex protein RnfB [hydrothermal vent metagenome]|uniref:Electron transport complex protein RnfB n=1 Tax=hydrothermal vent metagenome TaxID=652676 RepID=A0A3B0W3M5_9ZZZZ